MTRSQAWPEATQFYALLVWRPAWFGALLYLHHWFMALSLNQNLNSVF